MFTLLKKNGQHVSSPSVKTECLDRPLVMACINASPSIISGGPFVQKHIVHKTQINCPERWFGSLQWSFRGHIGDFFGDVYFENEFLNL